MKPVVLSIQAAEEYRKALEYYFRISDDLAGEFIQDALQTKSFIQDFPEASGFVRNKLRYRSLTHFPYGFFFKVLENMTLIIAVKHHHESVKKLIGQ